MTLVIDNEDWKIAINRIPQQKLMLFQNMLPESANAREETLSCEESATVELSITRHATEASKDRRKSLRCHNH